MPTPFQELADAAYNGNSRQVDAKLEIYFSSTPLVVTQDEFLISFELLEELGAVSDSNPIGAPSSNELYFKLLNKDGIFSPSNVSSPYYSMMKPGVQVKVFVKERSLAAWEPMGTFYVEDWTAAVTSLQASVTCYDRLYDVFNADLVSPRALHNPTYIQAFNSFFSAFLYEYTVDPILAGTLTWWYGKESNTETVQQLAEASVAAVFCDRYNHIAIKDMTQSQEVRAVLRDSDQIVSASVPQSINRVYNGLAIMLNEHQLSELSSVLDVAEFNVPVGIQESAEYTFTSLPVARIESINVVSNSVLISYVKHNGNTNTIKFTLSNQGFGPFKVNLRVWGRLAEVVKTVYNKFGTNQLMLDNVYVQNSNQAAKQTQILDRLIRSNLPTVEVDIRGNPAIHLGSKIQLLSPTYNLNMTGIVQRARYTYAGYLKCSINVIDSTILEVT